MTDVPRATSAPPAWRTLVRLAPFLAPYRARIALAGASLVVAAAAMLAVPFAFRLLIDRGFAAPARTTNAGGGPRGVTEDGPGAAADASTALPTDIDAVFLALFGVALVLALSTAVRFYCVSWLGDRLVADLRKAVFASVLRQDPVFFETLRPGEVLSRLSSDTTLIQTLVGSSLSLGLRNALLFAGALALMIWTSPSLASVIVALLLLVVVPLIVVGRRVRRLSRDSQDRLADSGARAGETLGAMATVQSYVREAMESRRYAAAVEEAFASALRRNVSRATLTAVAITLVFGAIVFVLWLGARAVAGGELSPGTLTQFMLYAALVGGSVGVLSEVLGDVQRAAGAAERLLELLDARPSIRSGPRTLTRADVPFPAASDGGVTGGPSADGDAANDGDATRRSSAGDGIATDADSTTESSGDAIVTSAASEIAANARRSGIELERARRGEGTNRPRSAAVPRAAAPEAGSSSTATEGGARVELDEVGFRYPSRPDDPALDGLSFTVEPGETVALVGPSGAGKTTVLQLLLRFYDPTEGELRLDGVPLPELSLEALRGAIGLVAQESVVFSDDVAANLRYGRPDASEEALRAVARDAQAHAFIERLPEGYATALGERGVRLSGGQRQRLSIARALIKDPPLLLLDEATSALDAESERQVQLALERAMRGRTTIVIAHRLATVVGADRILVMDEGRLVESGTHAELAARDGLYARLAAMQFGAAAELGARGPRRDDRSSI